jgi:hypothetical protein
LAGHVERVDGRESTALRPSVAAFNDLIDSDPVVGMLVARMVEQVPQGRDYSQRHVRDVDHLLAMIDGVLDIAPNYGQENVTLPMGDGGDGAVVWARDRGNHTLGVGRTAPAVLRSPRGRTRVFANTSDVGEAGTNGVPSTTATGLRRGVRRRVRGAVGLGPGCGAIRTRTSY